MQEEKTRENADRLYQSWMNQAEQIKGVYPSFTLEAEMQNPRFTDLLRNGIDLRTAYEVLHKDEIIPAAMQFTAQNVEQKLTNKIMANGARPTENGLWWITFLCGCRRAVFMDSSAQTAPENRPP